MGSSTNLPAPNRGILRPERLVDQEMRNTIDTAQSRQRSEADEEIESEHQEQKYYYFILGRGYDQDLNLVYDGRKNNKNKSSENLTSQTDDETLSETEPLSPGNNGLMRARDSITLYSQIQAGSDNARESIAREAQREDGTTPNSPVSKPSFQPNANRDSPVDSWFEGQRRGILGILECLISLFRATVR